VGAVKVSSTVDVKLLVKYEFMSSTDAIHWRYSALMYCSAFKLKTNSSRSPPVDSSPKLPAKKIKKKSCDPVS
jgi:hypothetical protein